MTPRQVRIFTQNGVTKRQGGRKGEAAVGREESPRAKKRKSAGGKRQRGSKKWPWVKKQGEWVAGVPGLRKGKRGTGIGGTTQRRDLDILNERKTHAIIVKSKNHNNKRERMRDPKDKDTVLS